MKKIQLKFLLCIIGFIGLINSCKTKEIDPRIDINWANMQVNGKSWKSQSSVYNIVKDSLLFFGFSNGYFNEGRFVSIEGLSIISIPKKIGRTTLNLFFHPNFDSIPEAEYLSKAYSYFGTSYIDGDVICEQFRLDTTDATNNWIEITRQEDNFKKVWGTFSATLVKTSECNEPRYPGEDTLRIRNGKFYTEVSE